MKVKQLLYGMMYGLLIFFTVSCSEENSENLPDNVAIYQSYLVAFSDSQPTLTYARFSPEKDVPLKEIKLTGGASIMANGKEMEYHYFDGNTIFGYSYSLALGKDEQVSFVFQRKRQQETRMLTNYAYKEWINEIHIPSELITITNQEVVGWKGEKIASNEELEATLDSPSHLEEYTAYYGTLNESRDGISFKNVPKGKYMLTLKRILKLETKDNDAPAKGEIRLVFYDKKEVTVK
ncbi:MULTISPECIES: hypothetical protein [Phocaeicola]|jgi:hypothetical protein|uniref:Uncharacterized protein n=1 Tax=Phocaeicola plebeius TaxID=310297 RepID=A0A3E4VZZ1_9BACT|nr:hypothetical protein [Phocaeicola plebeius]RGM35541.1 hypothetical protein DXC17_14705 [Phocaeicola plebeius]RGQ72103.1 hypothetical protein DWY86_10480 [Phocaeicola plebeius]RGQ91434.1 hypothetical protein DWY72_10695 [Phocaeicola plebeius]RGR90505.1 hypothetical protein DWY21_04415 [Phocaeicola plebeius]RGS09227.1 hypothetical protein DWY14_04450 [Phocaeicola plebeius]